MGGHEVVGERCRARGDGQLSAGESLWAADSGQVVRERSTAKDSGQEEVVERLPSKICRREAFLRESDGSNVMGGGRHRRRLGGRRGGVITGQEQRGGVERAHERPTDKGASTSSAKG